MVIQPHGLLSVFKPHQDCLPQGFLDMLFFLQMTFSPLLFTWPTHSLQLLAKRGFPFLHSYSNHISLFQPSYHSSNFISIQPSHNLLPYAQGWESPIKPCTVVPPLLWGIPSGWLKEWTVPNPTYTVFFSHIYIPMIKLNL